MTDRTDTTVIAFHSSGVSMTGRFHPPHAGPAAAPAPVVVMAHGLGGTVDSGLEPFAERLSAAGLAVFAFDYRGFGASGGLPRQRVDLAGQLDDYRAACAAAACLPGVDPGRIVMWGVSLSGGHVLQVAAGREDVAAVIAVAPMVSGPAAARHALPQHRPATLVRSGATGLTSALRQRVGAAPMRIPLVDAPGRLAALTADGYAEAYRAIAGPTWRNEVDATVGTELGRYRTHRAAKELGAREPSIPTLFQIADFDRAAPPHAAAKAAFTARAEVRHYPCDHFDVFPGRDWFDAVVAHQLHFLARHGVLPDPESFS